MERPAAAFPSFEDKGLIPLKHTGYGADCSPELVLGGLSGRPYRWRLLWMYGTPCPRVNHGDIWNMPAAPV